MKSIFENIAYLRVYFLWQRWLGLWLMLLSEATGAGLGPHAHKRSPHPLKPGCSGEQGTKVRISLLGVRARTVQLYCTVTVHWLQQLSWALQSLQHLSDKVTLQCTAASHWSPSNHKYLSLDNRNFSEFDENMNYIKGCKNRVQFQKNDTWKVNGCQSECLW